jgi:UDP-3-O-[3-hydroxymyristoyl] glucosamine N-acyltransferase
MMLDELAAKISATVRGDGARAVAACAAIDKAGPDDVAFVANRKYLAHLKTTRAAAVILGPKDVDDAPAALSLLIADDPYFAFRNAMIELHGWRQHPAPGISPHAYVDPTAVIEELCTIRPSAYIAPQARLGRRCVIYPGCYVGKHAVLGDDCVLYPNVVVYDKCVLGDRVTLHSSTVIGQDGFGYATHALPGQAPAHHKIPQAGNVVIEDDVEMGANCSIDRATIGSTVIRKGTKFSDGVTIGHGCDVGEHNLLVAQVGLAGSVTTGKYVVMGGQVGVAGHLTIGDQVQIAAKAGVMHDLNANKQYGGAPATEFTDTKRQLLALTRLPDLLATIRRLEKRIAELEARAADAQRPG